MRLFVAIDPTGEQREQLRQLQERLGTSLDGVRWVHPAALHLTLKFLGEQSEERLPVIFEAMRKAAAPAGPFTLQFGRAGVFPSPQRARVIWAGVRTGASDLGTLAGALEAALAEQGFPPGKRSYRAHLTLGRLRRPFPEKQLRDLLEAELSFSTAKYTVQSMRLYRSFLSPRGARYTVLKEISFARDRGK